jgi:hypothetical protein
VNGLIVVGERSLDSGLKRARKMVFLGYGLAPFFRALPLSELWRPLRNQRSVPLQSKENE